VAREEKGLEKERGWRRVVAREEKGLERERGWRRRKGLEKVLWVEYLKSPGHAKVIHSPTSPIASVH
jgi:hypothetical protein